MYCTGLAQMVERLTCNQQVLGSIPRFGFRFIKMIYFYKIKLSSYINYAKQLETLYMYGIKQRNE